MKHQFKAWALKNSKGYFKDMNGGDFIPLTAIELPEDFIMDSFRHAVNKVLCPDDPYKPVSVLVTVEEVEK